MSNVTMRGIARFKVGFLFKESKDRKVTARSVASEELTSAYQFTTKKEMMRSWYCW